MTSESSTAAHLRADGISLSFAERRVLTDISVTVASGERAGLIGENGTGKTTLLRVLAGLVEPDSGAVRAAAPGVSAPRIGLLHQEPPFCATDTVADAIEAAVAPIRCAEKALHDTAAALADQPEDPRSQQHYAQALDAAERLGVWGDRGPHRGGIGRSRLGRCAAQPRHWRSLRGSTGQTLTGLAVAEHP